MFINCPFCKALVATDPATDQPPEHCPRCAAKLHGVTADVPVPSVFPAPREGQAGVPALDPNFLLQIPAADDPPVRGAGDATPSELSSQIRQTVALETPAPAPTDRAAIAPIAAMLNPSGAAAPAAAPDDAGREAEPAGPAPTPAAVEAAPAGATQAAAPANAEQPLTDAGQAAAADAPDAAPPRIRKTPSRPKPGRRRTRESPHRHRPPRTPARRQRRPPRKRRSRQSPP